MEKFLILLSVGALASISVGAQTRVDTMYYDKKGIGVDNIALCAYYRIAAKPGDTTLPKLCRDYYFTGELLPEFYNGTYNYLKSIGIVEI